MNEKTRTILILGFLVLVAFVTRIHIFSLPQLRSVDEVVYYNLGRQLKTDFRDYNTIVIAKYLTEERGRSLPPYFTEPLFKHPPLFSLMIAQALGLYGDDMASAEIVSLGFAVLTIPLVYLLGTLFFGRLVGLAAALFLFLDPISIMCSQKVWMETTLTFFTVLSLYFFILAIKKNQDGFFILSGISTGLAVLTKYPGILPVVIQTLYAAFYYPNLYRKRKFWLCLFIPVLMSLPWFYWNYCVYGSDFITQHFTLHGFSLRMPQTITALLFLGILLGIAFAAGFQKQIRIARTLCRSFIKNDVVWIIGAMLFFIFFAKQILWNLQFNHLPSSSWAQGLFARENLGFYFGRLMEYSLIYALAFLGFFISFTDEREQVMLLRFSSLVILGFYAICGNYQSRYILAALPFLLILGIRTWEYLWDFMSTHRLAQVRVSGRILLIVLMTYLICKTIFINQFLSFTNNMCYF